MAEYRVSFRVLVSAGFLAAACVGRIEESAPRAHLPGLTLSAASPGQGLVGSYAPPGTSTTVRFRSHVDLDTPLLSARIDGPNGEPLMTLDGDYVRTPEITLAGVRITDHQGLSPDEKRAIAQLRSSPEGRAFAALVAELPERSPGLSDEWTGLHLLQLVLTAFADDDVYDYWPTDLAKELKPERALANELKLARVFDLATVERMREQPTPPHIPRAATGSHTRDVLTGLPGGYCQNGSTQWWSCQPGVVGGIQYLLDAFADVYTCPTMITGQDTCVGLCGPGCAGLGNTTILPDKWTCECLKHDISAVKTCSKSTSTGCCGTLAVAVADYFAADSTRPPTWSNSRNGLAGCALTSGYCPTPEGYCAGPNWHEPIWKPNGDSRGADPCFNVGETQAEGIPHYLYTECCSILAPPADGALISFRQTGRLKLGISCKATGYGILRIGPDSAACTQLGKCTVDSFFTITRNQLDWLHTYFPGDMPFWHVCTAHGFGWYDVTGLRPGPWLAVQQSITEYGFDGHGTMDVFAAEGNGGAYQLAGCGFPVGTGQIHAIATPNNANTSCNAKLSWWGYMGGNYDPAPSTSTCVFVRETGAMIGCNYSMTNKPVTWIPAAGWHFDLRNGTAAYSPLMATTKVSCAGGSTCVASCAGVACGQPDGCGGTCCSGDGCLPANCGGGCRTANACGSACVVAPDGNACGPARCGTCSGGFCDTSGCDPTCRGRICL